MPKVLRSLKIRAPEKYTSDEAVSFTYLFLRSPDLSFFVLPWNGCAGCPRGRSSRRRRRRRGRTAPPPRQPGARAAVDTCLNRNQDLTSAIFLLSTRPAAPSLAWLPRHLVWKVGRHLAAGLGKKHVATQSMYCTPGRAVSRDRHFWHCSRASTCLSDNNRWISGQ